ncbi:acetyltransferase (plasmid) [Ensifer sp. D2-11]
MAPAAYTFRPAAINDLPLLQTWQSLPHVREWWDDGKPFDGAELCDTRVTRWIVELNGQPFAYMQDYSVHGWEEHHFGHLPPGSRGIDQYIGVPAMIGGGHGTAFIRQRMHELFAAGAPVIAVDPHPENTRAITVYRKLGFRIAGAERVTPWGLILPMEARPRQLAE